MKIKPETLRMILGGATALFGFYLFWLLTEGAIKSHSELSTAMWWFMALLQLLFAAIVVMTIWFGISLLREMSETRFRRVAAIVSFYIGAASLSILATAPVAALTGKMGSHLASLFATLLGLLAYIVIVRLLLPRLDGRKPMVYELINNGMVSLIAFQIWLILGTAFHEYTPKQFSYEHDNPGAWMAAEVFIPIIAAYLFHKTTCYYLKNRRSESPGPLSAKNVVPE